MTGLNLQVDCGESVSFFEENVNEDGFTLQLEQQQRCQLNWGSISWLAFTEDMGFCEGTVDFRPHHPVQVQLRTVELPVGKFHKPPQVLVAFKRIDLSRDGILYQRMRVVVECIDETRFDLVVVSWENSIFHGATVHWLAIPSESSDS
jgi:hypothetical protein